MKNIIKLTNTINNKTYYTYSSSNEKITFTSIKNRYKNNNNITFKDIFVNGIENIKIELLEKCDNDEVKEIMYNYTNDDVNSVNVINKIGFRCNPEDYHKKYYEKTRETRLKDLSTRIMCSCGIETSKSNYKKHLLTSKHKKYLNNIENVNNVNICVSCE